LIKLKIRRMGAVMYQRFVLSNGIRVISERMSSVRTVAIGVWVGAGSRFEQKANNGVSHFIEHMLFKGTRTRTAKQIAEEMDSIGGQINAFTAKDCTCLYAKTLDVHVEKSIDILSDIMLNSKLTKPDINLERNVIIEEINLFEDSPEELVHDILTETVWQKSPLGMPIQGTAQSLQAIEKADLRDYLTATYIPENIVISVAGNYDEAELVKKLERRFCKIKKDPERDAPLADKPRHFAAVNIRHKDTEQVHLCIGMKGIELGNDENYMLQLVNYVFGGGMSSILFQKIREDLGLVYSIYSYISAYRNAGLFTIYAGMNADNADKVFNMAVDEVKAFRESGMTEELLGKAKEQFKGNYMMGIESSNSRMTANGRSELLLGYVHTPEEVLEKVERVTLDCVKDVLDKTFDLGKMVVAAIGKVDDKLDKTLRSA
jgi:predicted Zn-dependent peptidase